MTTNETSQPLVQPQSHATTHTSHHGGSASTNGQQSIGESSHGSYGRGNGTTRGRGARGGGDQKHHDHGHRGARGGGHNHGHKRGGFVANEGESSRGGQHRGRGRGGRGGGTQHRGGHAHHHNNNGNNNEAISDEEAASIALAMSLSRQEAAAAAAAAPPVPAPPVVAGVKGNANHLLSFHFAPVAAPPRGHAGSSSHSSIRRVRRAPTSSFNKETFVHANYHFVVSPGDHTPSLSDPDIPVDWHHVQLVFYPITSTTAIVCPICLDPPVAAKMTKCGHVFCYACILHYLELADQEFDRCPLCFESVYLDSLKSLHFMKHDKYDTNDQVEFTLVKRSKDSVIPYSRVDGRGITAAYTLQRAQFARITITRDIADIITRERAELYDALHRPGHEDDTKMWLQAAIDEVNERERRWYSIHGQPTPRAPPTSTVVTPTPVPITDPKLVRAASDPLSSKASESSFPALTRTPSAITPSSNSTNSNQTKKTAVKTLAPLVGTATSPSVITSSSSSLSSPLAADNSSNNDEKKVASKKKLNAKATTFTPTPTPNDTTDDTSQKDSTTNSTDTKSTGVRARDAFFEPGETDPSVTQDEKTQTNGTSASPSIAANEARRGKTDNDDIYFYQSADGQQFYLHNLNHRAFKAEFGSEDAFPHKIVGRVLEHEKFTQNDATRRRYKYLAHLPSTTEFTIALIDHTTLCSADTNRKFASEMKEMSVARAKRLRQLKAHNKRLDQKAAEAQNYHRGPTLASALAGDIASGQQSFPNLADNPFGFSLSGDAAPSPHSSSSNDTNTNANSDMPLAARLSHWSSVAKRGMAGNDTWVALPTATPSLPAVAAASSSSSSNTSARLTRQPSSGSSPSMGALAPSLTALSSTAAAIAAITNTATAVVATVHPTTPSIPVTPMVATVVRQASGVDESRPDRVFAPMTRKSDTLFGGSPSLSSSSSATIRSPPLMAATTPTSVIPPMATTPSSPSLTPNTPPATGTGVAAAPTVTGSKSTAKKGKQTLFSSGSQRAYR